MSERSLTSSDVMLLLNIDVTWHVTGVSTFDNAEFHRPGRLADYHFTDKSGQRKSVHIDCYGAGTIEVAGREITGHDQFLQEFPDGVIPRNITWLAPSWIEVSTPTSGRSIHRFASTAQAECLDYLKRHAAI